MSGKTSSMIVLATITAGTVFTLTTTYGADPQSQPKPTIAKICTNCHKAEPKTLWGTFDSVAFKAKTIQLRIDDAVELIQFDEDDIKVLTSEGKAMDGEALHQTKKGHELKIEYAEKDGVKTALRIVEKRPVKIAEGMLITTAEMERLVSQGPGKGGYYLYDSRPLPRFQEGAIPGAVSLPYPDFDKQVDKLPADKNALIVFYCGGTSCSMSPASADKAIKLGYTNVKVFQSGIPAWSEKNAAVLSAQSLKEAWFDKDRPRVLLDVRPAKQAAKGFIAGAVSFPGAQAAKLIKALPAKEKKPPIIIYDANDGREAGKVAKELLKAGYGDVKILLGGYRAWTGAKYASASGKLPVKASYTPKPRPGEIDLEEFKRDLVALPADVLILDVRNADEVKAGMLKGAKNIPAEEFKQRLAEIPKGKHIVTQCTTGVRAEMAYYALKELGYPRVSFVNAKIQFNKNGSYTITKE